MESLKLITKKPLTQTKFNISFTELEMTESVTRERLLDEFQNPV